MWIRNPVPFARAHALFGVSAQWDTDKVPKSDLMKIPQCQTQYWPSLREVGPTRTNTNTPKPSSRSIAACPSRRSSNQLASSVFINNDKSTILCHTYCRWFCIDRSRARGTITNNPFKIDCNRFDSTRPLNWMVDLCYNIPHPV